jgi:signal peptidase I
LPEKIIPDGPIEADPSERAFRRKALIRSWFCPGAGFALLGQKGLGLLTFLASFGMLPAIIWIALQPVAAAAWTALGILVVALTLSLTEQFACKRAALQPLRSHFLVTRFPVAVILFWSTAVCAMIALILGFGSLQLAGSGMSPTLGKGERFLYSKRLDADRLQHGTVIVYRLSDASAWGKAGWLTVGRILATPGDRLAIRDRSYVVNGKVGPVVADTRPYDPVVSVPSEPDAITVLENHYFVAQDNPSGGYDSRVLSWVQGENIVADRLFHFGVHDFLRPVE